MGEVDTSYKIIFLLLVFCGLVDEVVDFNLVAQEASQSCEALEELRAFGRLISHELNLAAEVLVVDGQPFGKTAGFIGLVNWLEHGSSVLVLVELGVGGLVGSHVDGGGGLGLYVLELDADVVEVLEADDPADCSRLDQLHGVLHTVDHESVSDRDVLEEGGDQRLLLHELDVGERLCGLLNGLVESVLEAVGDVDDVDDLGLEPGVEHLGLIEVVLEISTTGKDDAADVALVVSDKGLLCDLADLAQVVVTLLDPETGETDGRLTSLVVLLGEFDGELIEDFAGVALEGGVEGAVTVNNDEAEGRLVDQQLLLEVGQVELGVAVVDRQVDRLERLEVADQLLLTGRVLIHDLTREHHEAVVGRPLVKLESLTG